MDTLYRIETLLERNIIMEKMLKLLDDTFQPDKNGFEKEQLPQTVRYGSNKTEDVQTLKDAANQIFDALLYPCVSIFWYETENNVFEDLTIPWWSTLKDNKRDEFEFAVSFTLKSDVDRLWFAERFDRILNVNGVKCKLRINGQTVEFGTNVHDHYARMWSAILDVLDSDLVTLFIGIMWLHYNEDSCEDILSQHLEEHPEAIKRTINDPPLFKIMITVKQTVDPDKFANTIDKMLACYRTICRIATYGSMIEFSSSNPDHYKGMRGVISDALDSKLLKYIDGVLWIDCKTGETEDVLIQFLEELEKESDNGDKQ